MKEFKDYTIKINPDGHKKIIKNYFSYIGGKDKDGNCIDLNNVYFEKIICRGSH